MQEEKQLKECKVCHEVKERIHDGKYPDEKNTRWVNQDGKQWSGRTCPECHVQKMNLLMQKKRGKTNELVS